MKNYYNAAAETIKEYKRMRQIFLKDREEFEIMAKKAIEGAIDSGKSKESQKNMLKLQKRILSATVSSCL